MQLIPAELVRQYKRAMLNIHPALLPNFGGKGLYGGRVHSAVIGSGARFSGPTIHFVDEGCVPRFYSRVPVHCSLADLHGPLLCCVSASSGCLLDMVPQLLPCK